MPGRRPRTDLPVPPPHVPAWPRRCRHRTATCRWQSRQRPTAGAGPGAWAARRTTSTMRLGQALGAGLAAPWRGQQATTTALQARLCECTQTRAGDPARVSGRACVARAVAPQNVRELAVADR